MREHEPRHAIGQRRLADALRAADQPGMRNAPAAIGVQQRRLRLAMPEQIGRLARMPDRGLLLGLARAHAVLAVAGIANRWSRSAVQTRAATVSGIGIGVDQRAALRVFGRDLLVGVAQVLMELDVLRLETIGRAAAAPGGRALQADFDGDVENDGQVRLEIADGDALHRVEHAGRDLPQPALIGARRIREAVAQHPECPD